ncbi:SDR family NAD(P)-dependent oxidoreductase [Natrarchaeobius chitinivorans]|uniref:SDR family oxidoreductase n=1 Tax=Natrarchaeobius chitinivorans TaxID=1679083 RepID=A0A3N6MIC5_NATCH|nr:SDR family oxidoreductase [Natrarchaeobius chitinivorans]RQG95401.1 SDR family oxidoreductase [Natrarchaeobius chitinivorans]
MATYDFTDDVVMITGGARGLGRNHALAFADAGADVVLADVQDADPVVSEITSRGASGLWTPCDVTDEAAVEAAVATAVDRFGRIDVLINNAGIARTGRLTELDAETWRSVLEVNLTGTWLCAKHVARQMRETGATSDRREDGKTEEYQSAGRIVNTASFFGHQPVPGLGAYSASKFGVRSTTRTLALELADHGIRVNAVSPIGVRTEAVDEYDDDTRSVLESGTDWAGRYNALEPGERLEADDVTNAVLWLSSDDSRFVTGVTLPVDAGGLA